MSPSVLHRFWMGMMGTGTTEAFTDPTAPEGGTKVVLAQEAQPWTPSVQHHDPPGLRVEREKGLGGR